MNGPLLMNERFVAVFPSLVRALRGDLTAAAVLQHVNYRAQAAKPAGDGRRWLELPLAEIAEEIGLSVDQIQRATKRLRDGGLLLSRGQTGRGNHLYWAVDHEAIESLIGKDADPRASSRAESTQDRGTNDAAARQKGRGSASPSLLIEETKKEENLPATVVAPNSGQVITAWIDGLRNRPPDRVVGQTAREVRLLLEQGFDPRVVLEALRSISAKGLHPSTLASEVNTIINPPTTMRGGANTAEQRLNGLSNLLVGSDRGSS